MISHVGVLLALDHPLSERYRLGATFSITDPATKAPATRNPFLRPKPGVLLSDEMAIDRLLARGVIFGACDVALRVLSGKLAGNANVTPEVALKEWNDGVIPGIVVIPSGVWGVNRAQLAGCTYCAAG